jgi:RNA polymerase-binding transcription factor DksA
MVMTLSREQLDELKRAVESRYEELAAEVRADVSRARDDTAIGLAGDVVDAGDRASADQIVRMDDAELLRDLEELNQMQAARSRLGSGDFGRCVDCDHEIPYERLRAQAAALRCLDCQRVWEGALAQTAGQKQ